MGSAELSVQGAERKSTRRGRIGDLAVRYRPKHMFLGIAVGILSEDRLARYMLSSIEDHAYSDRRTLGGIIAASRPLSCEHEPPVSSIRFFCEYCVAGRCARPTLHATAVRCSIGIRFGHVASDALCGADPEQAEAYQSNGNEVLPKIESKRGLKIPSPLELFVMMRRPSPLLKHMP
jgi:hypothetical protein